MEELRRLAEINAVEQEIADIGEVTEEKKEQIQNVREKYEALSEEEKGMVSNSDILREAEERLEKLKLLCYRRNMEIEHCWHYLSLFF